MKRLEEEQVDDPEVNHGTGKVFSKVKLSSVILTIFQFSRQKLDATFLETANFKVSEIERKWIFDNVSFCLI